MKRWMLVAIAAFLAVFAVSHGSRVVASPASAASPPLADEQRAGWFGVFPQIDGYDVDFEIPCVGKTGFSQTAIYTSKTNRRDVFEISLVNGAVTDIEFLQKLPKVWQCHAKIGEKVGIFIEGYGDAPQSLSETVLRAIDHKRVVSALQIPPRTDFRLTKAAFQAIPANARYAGVIDWVGKSEKDIGSGIHIMAYPLVDGGRALVGTPDLKTVVYVHFQTKDEAAQWRGP